MIYPPYLDSTIPAFTDDKIVVPFSNNPAVGVKEICGYELKITDLATNEYEKITYIALSDDEIESVYNNQKAIFSVTDDLKEMIKKYSYYKIQLSYIPKKYTSNGNEASTEGNYEASAERAWSNVAMAKYSVMPTISIIPSENSNLYKGTYCINDPMESIYSYRFILSSDSENKNIIQDTGEVINYDGETNFKDGEFTNTNKFKINYDLEPEKQYYLTYWVKTANGIELSSPPFTIIRYDTLLPYLVADFVITSYPEEAYFNITLKPKDNTDSVTGHYYLLRTDENSNYKYWEILGTYHVTNDLGIIDYNDYAIENNVQYKYAIQQFNTNYNLCSDRMESGYYRLNFEHMYLFDKDRQLAIKYNPKVSSFKTTLLENKTDTIGGKYPVFFRNGDVSYKEIPISGLISYWMDEQEQFMTLAELGIDTRETNLTDANFLAERKFKLEVLDWLNNGQPKVFKSAAEGNYVIRLMNVSLSPNDTLGRMLHTFSATGYECAEYSVESLINHELIPQKEVNGADNTPRGYTESLISSSAENIEITLGTLNKYEGLSNTVEGITSFEISGAKPGQQVKIIYNDLETINIAIGSSGALNYDTLSDNSSAKIKQVIISPYMGESSGQITCYYVLKPGTANSEFDKIKKARTADSFISYQDAVTIPIGYQNDVNSYITKIYSINAKGTGTLTLTYANGEETQFNNDITNTISLDFTNYNIEQPSSITITPGMTLILQARTTIIEKEGA